MCTALLAVCACSAAGATGRTWLHPTAAGVDPAQVATLLVLEADPFDPMHNVTSIEAIGSGGAWVDVRKLQFAKGGHGGIRLQPGRYLLRVNCEGEEYTRHFDAEAIDVVAGADYHVECRGHTTEEARVRIAQQPHLPDLAPLPVRTALVDMPAGFEAPRIAQAIKAALANRGWMVAGEEPGHIDARIQVREHAATVRIDYDPREVTFAYVDSANLDHEVDGGVTYMHRNYYNWIHFLASDIGLDLAGQPLER